MAMALLDVGDHEAENDGVRVLGNLSINLENFRVGVAGEVIYVTYHEMELLRVLSARPDKVISYDEITQALWGNSSHTSVRHLNVLVHRLRLKLSASKPYVIETVRGRGYGLLKARELENADDWSS